MKRSMVDPRGYTTTYNYTCNDTFLSQTTFPNSQTKSVTPDCSSGQSLTATDQNGKTTSYGYDALGRKASITYPDNGKTSYSYPQPTQVTETKSISANVSSTSTTIWDGYGRKSTVTTSDPNGSDTVTYTYGNNLSSKCVYNPQRSTPSSTDGTTCYLMDILGRVTGITQPDGKTIGVLYLGNQATVTDENGHQKQYTYDAFHDLTSVLEPNANGTPAWPTTYAYDGAGHVINVNQVGDGSSAAIGRSFAYDSLGRMIQQVTPESGTTSYGYDGNGNLTSKTDGRGITTTYQYDVLNRLTSKTYSGSDPAETASSCYQYDQSSVSGATSGAAGNMLGRLSNEWTQEGVCPPSPPSSGVITRRSILAYDPMGRVLSEQQCTPANCTTGAPFTPTYSYDLAGDVQSSTNGTGLVSFSDTYDAAGHLSTLTSSWNDATHPPVLFSAPSYTPAGALTSATFGTGLNLNRIYDSRQRITNETDTGAAVQ